MYNRCRGHTGCNGQIQKPIWFLVTVGSTLHKVCMRGHESGIYYDLSVLRSQPRKIRREICIVLNCRNHLQVPLAAGIGVGSASCVVLLGLGLLFPATRLLPTSRTLHQLVVSPLVKEFCATCIQSSRCLALLSPGGTVVDFPIHARTVGIDLEAPTVIISHLGHLVPYIMSLLECFRSCW